MTSQLKDNLANRMTRADRVSLFVTTFAITDGPGKWDLSVGLFEGKSGSGQKELFFEAEGLVIIKLNLNSVGREDGSAESFILEGYARVMPNPESYCCKIYFDTRRRRGTIRFIK